MKKKKLEFIEGFKGFACFCVILSHFVLAFCAVFASGSTFHANGSSKFELLLSKTPFNLFYSGSFGVRVFFIVSGLVLSYAYFVNKDEMYLKRGVVKRYFRLLFPVVVVNIFVFFLMKFNLMYNTQVSIFTKYPEWIGKFNNFTPNFFEVLKQAFIGNFFQFESTYVSPLWTISYEIYGAFLVFAFLSLFGREKIRYLLYVLFILLFKESNYSQFMIGVLICDFMVNGGKYYEKFKSKKWLICLTGILGIYFASYPFMADVHGTIYQFIHYNISGINTVIMNHFIGASLIILSIVSSPFLQKIFEMKPFRFLGKYSFGLYLIHWPIMISLSSYILLKGIEGPFGYYELLLIDFIITMIVVCILAVLLVKFVDSRGIAFANKVADCCFSDSVNKRKDIKNK